MKSLFTMGVLTLAVCCLPVLTQAQQHWGQQSQSRIGSYQSIMSAYGQQNPAMGQQAQTFAQPAVQQQWQQPQVQPVQSQAPTFRNDAYASYGYQDVVPQAPHTPQPPMTQLPAQGAPVMNPAQSYETGHVYPHTAPAPTYHSGNGYNSCGTTPGFTAPTYTQPVYSSPVANSFNGCSAPTYSPAVSAPACSAPVCQQNYGLVQAATPKRSRNRVIGVRGLVFDRDYEDNRYLGYNNAGDELFSNDADHGWEGGTEVFFQSRNCNGRGFEVRYFTIFSQLARAGVVGDPYPTSVLGGHANINHLPSGFDVYSIYNNADDFRLVRETDIHNLEFNMLRNGGCFTAGRCRQVNYELLGGFRWFEFDESIRFSAFGSQAGYPTEQHYTVGADNTLLGFQIGGRTETCLTKRIRISAMTKVGIFNNNIRSRQQLFDENDIYSQISTGPWTGTDYDVTSTKNDVSMLGELDFGLIYCLGCKSRATIGYRAVGVSGVALAVDQYPYDFTSLREIGTINSNGNLILHGGYAGLEWCF